MQALFGPSNNKIGYHYLFSENEEFIKHVEVLWIIVRQHTQLPNTRLINKVEAKGIVCKKKGQEVNWVVFVEWTIRDQLWRLSSLEVGQGVVEVGRAIIERQEGDTKEEPTQLEQKSHIHVSKRGSHPCSSIENLIKW